MIQVLIVEDDPMVADLNRRYLAKIEGFKTKGIAGSYQQALEMLALGGIDLVLVDIFMPGLNGLELLAKIREVGHGVDIIMVTAARDTDSVKQALRLGAVDYLIKPFEFERLAMALQKYKARVDAIHSRELVCQRDIDTQFLERPACCSLPKGLDKNTLHMIKGLINKSGAFTIEEMAKHAGISRVTLRKYLDYLVDNGRLTIELVYGPVGRPVNRYVPCETE